MQFKQRYRRLFGRIGLILLLIIPSVSATIWDPFSLSSLKDTFVTYANWKRNVNGSGYNISVDDFKTTDEGLEWIKPENVFDIDDEDVESDLNTYVDIGGDVMTGDLSIKDSDGEFHNLSRDLQISDEMSRNITLSGLNGTLDSSGNLTITTLSGENIAVNIDKDETILSKSSDSIIITSGTNESPILNQIIYVDASNPILAKRTTLSLKSPSVAAYLQGANFTYASAVGLATTDNLIGGMFNRWFRDGSTYRSGFVINVSTVMVNISTGVISFLFSEIKIILNHSTSDLYVHVHTDGSFHQHDTLDDCVSYNDGSAVSNNKYFNTVFGVAITHDGKGVMYATTQDKPSTEYTKAIDAEVDLEDTINYFPPDDIVSLAYIPIVRVVTRLSGGVNTIQTLSNGLLFDDLRGTVTKTSSSPPPSGITSHSDLTNLAWSVAGHTIDDNVDMGGNDLLNAKNINATGNLTIHGLATFDKIPMGTGTAQGSVYINPPSGDTNFMVLGVAKAGSTLFTVDADGDAEAIGTIKTDGSVQGGELVFVDDTDTGLFAPGGDGTIEMQVGGSAILVSDGTTLIVPKTISSLAIKPSTGNNFDVGTSGNKYRDGWFNRNLYATSFIFSDDTDTFISHTPGGANTMRVSAGGVAFLDIGTVGVTQATMLENTKFNKDVDVVADLTAGTIQADDGFTGDCINATYVGGIATGCND